MEESKFLKIQCPRCGQEKIVFGKSSYEVKCLQCNYLITKSNGGKAKIRARIKEVLQ